jgi:hypothetical protein
MSSANLVQSCIGCPHFYADMTPSNAFTPNFTVIPYCHLPIGTMCPRVTLVYKGDTKEGFDGN